MKKQYFLTITLIIAGGLFGNALRFFETTPDRSADFSIIPNNLAGYYGSEQALADFAYDILKADVTTLRDYITMNGVRLQLFIAYFGSQKYGSQIHSPKHCLPGGGWRIVNIHPFTMDLAGGKTKLMNRLLLAAKNHKAVMLYWFETRSGSIRSEYGLKLDLVKNSLLFRPTDAAIVRLIIYAGDSNIEAATGEGIRFFQQFSPFVESSLPF